MVRGWVSKIVKTGGKPWVIAQFREGTRVGGRPVHASPWYSTTPVCCLRQPGPTFSKSTIYLGGEGTLLSKMMTLQIRCSLPGPLSLVPMSPGANQRSLVWVQLCSCRCPNVAPVPVKTFRKSPALQDKQTLFFPFPACPAPPTPYSS